MASDKEKAAGSSPSPNPGGAGMPISPGRPAPPGDTVQTIGKMPGGEFLNSPTGKMLANAILTGAFGPTGGLISLGLGGGLGNLASQIGNLFKGQDPQMKDQPPNDAAPYAGAEDPNAPPPAAPPPATPSTPWTIGNMPSGAGGGGVGVGGVGLGGSTGPGGGTPYGIPSGEGPGIPVGVPVGSGSGVTPGTPGSVPPGGLWNAAPVNGYFMNQAARSALVGSQRGILAATKSPGAKVNGAGQLLDFSKQKVK